MNLQRNAMNTLSKIMLKDFRFWDSVNVEMSIFFSLNDCKVCAGDSSIVAIEGNQKFNEKNDQSINAKC